jgi:hypothetical protein
MYCYRLQINWVFKKKKFPKYALYNNLLIILKDCIAGAWERTGQQAKPLQVMMNLRYLLRSLGFALVDMRGESQA